MRMCKKKSEDNIKYCLVQGLEATSTLSVLVVALLSWSHHCEFGNFYKFSWSKYYFPTKNNFQ